MGITQEREIRFNSALRDMSTSHVLGNPLRPQRATSPVIIYLYNWMLHAVTVNVNAAFTHILPYRLVYNLPLRCVRNRHPSKKPLKSKDKGQPQTNALSVSLSKPPPPEQFVRSHLPTPVGEIHRLQ